MKQLSESMVRDVIETVFATMPGFEQSVQVPAPASPSPDAWSACVTVGGAFSGAVVVTAPRRFALRAANALLHGAVPEVSPELARDALGELANVIGGNLKSLIASLKGGHCQLSLPTVSDGVTSVPDGVTLHSLWTDCAGEPVEVKVIAAPPGARPFAQRARGGDAT